MDAARGVADGVWCCAQGWARIASSPALLRAVAAGTALLSAPALAAAAALWAAALPFRAVFGVELDMGAAVTAACLLSLQVCRVVMPHVSGATFHAALRHTDPPLAATLAAAPVVWGPRQQLAMLGRIAAAVAALSAAGVAALVYAGPLLLPLLAAAVAGINVLLTVAVVGLLVAVGVAGGVAASAAAPLLRAWRLLSSVDRALPALVAAACVWGWWHGEPLLHHVLRGVVAYFQSCVLTRELLTQYTIRYPDQVGPLCSAHRWAVCGFGAPLWLCLSRHPAVGLLLLGGFHAAAAELLSHMIREHAKMGYGMVFDESAPPRSASQRRGRKSVVPPAGGGAGHAHNRAKTSAAAAAAAAPPPAAAAPARASMHAG